MPDYEAVKQDVIAIMKKPDWDDGSLGPGMFPAVLLLVFLECFERGTGPECGSRGGWKRTVDADVRWSSTRF
jgi:hypothetical protein